MHSPLLPLSLGAQRERPGAHPAGPVQPPFPPRSVPHPLPAPARRLLADFFLLSYFFSFFLFLSLFSFSFFLLSFPLSHFSFFPSHFFLLSLFIFFPIFLKFLKFYFERETFCLGIIISCRQRYKSTHFLFWKAFAKNYGEQEWK